MGAAITITAGGAPAPAALAALTAALTALIEQESAVAPDPLPAAYRSRWRRAALLEGAEVPVHLKHDGTPWGVQ